MIVNQDWYNINSYRKYPFKDYCTLIDITKRVTLPSNFIVDAIFSLSLNWQENFYLSKTTINSTELTLEVSCKIDSTVALSGTIQNPSYSSSNFSVTMYGLNSYVGSSGKIVIGSLSNIIEGTHTFNDAEFEPCRVLKLAKGVTSINGISDGPVILEAGQNVFVEVVGNVITIRALTDPCNCKDNGCKCIRTINGIEPVNNNIQISGIGCVTVSEGEQGIEIGNQCEDSCCGCDEVNDMIDRIRDLEERIIHLEA
jgi:hypothetical protein